MVLEIVKFPDKRLRQKCRPLTEDEIKNVAVLPETGKLLRELEQDMVETMAAANGLGLAAPQVGVPVRLFVMIAAKEENRVSVAAIANPVLSDLSGEQKVEEGCLSLPGMLVRTERAMKVTLASPSLSKELKFNKMIAACVQHEVDHLDGILITDNPRHKIIKA